MDLDLKGKRVLITASSAGIGKATAEAFLAEGSNVIINGRNEKILLEAAEKMKKDYPASEIDYFVGDMTKAEDLVRFKKYIKEKFNTIDILIPNLGNGKAIAVNQLDLSEWRRFIEINLLSTVGLVDTFISHIKIDGSIILISSITGLERTSAPFGYAASKAALIPLTKQLAEMYSANQIRVNCIIPGNIYFENGRWAEILKNDPYVMENYIEKEVPLKRFGKPEEIAASIVFLASSKSSFTTGAVLVVDGGQTRSFY